MTTARRLGTTASRVDRRGRCECRGYINGRTGARGGGGQVCSLAACCVEVHQVSQGHLQTTGCCWELFAVQCFCTVRQVWVAFQCASRVRKCSRLVRDRLKQESRDTLFHPCHALWSELHDKRVVSSPTRTWHCQDHGKSVAAMSCLSWVNGDVRRPLRNGRSAWRRPNAMLCRNFTAAYISPVPRHLPCHEISSHDDKKFGEVCQSKRG